MSGNRQQQYSTPAQSPFGQQTPACRISDQFTPATGFRGASLYQQTMGSTGTPGSTVHFAPTQGQQPPPPPLQQQESTQPVGSPNPLPPARTGPQSSKFVRTVDVPDSAMLNVDVTLKKDDYGLPGSSDYRKNMAMATAPLSDKFGVARH